MPSPFACVLVPLAALSLALPVPTFAQDSASPATNAPMLQPCIEPCLSAGTLVELEIGEPLSSATSKRGDAFAIKVHTALTQAGALLIPAGTAGIGEIIHADRSHGGGKPGELLIAARYLQLGDTQLPLHGLKFGGQGQDRSNVALGVAMAAGPFALFVHGKEIEIPAGTVVTAKLVQDFPSTAVGTLSVVAAPSAPGASIPTSSETSPTTAATASNKE